MRVLFIGGAGLIGTAAASAVRAAGHELWLVTRTPPVQPVAGGRALTADATDPVALRAVLAGQRFDVVVQWVGFTPEHVAQDVVTFADAGQYVFVSSASVYEKPPRSWLVTEAVPTVNPYWDYAQRKIACEQVLRDAHESSGFPMTIVRPSLTYGDSQLPLAIASWHRPYTVVDRMRRGVPVLVPGDGTSIWTITHNSDVARGLLGLLGHPGAVGEDVHITSDEALSWNQVYSQVGAAAGVEPHLLHVPTDGLVRADPGLLGTLVGDKIHSTVFDNSKLRSLVPGFTAQVPFSDGVRRTVAWFDADPARRLVDAAAGDLWDRVAKAYQDVLDLLSQPPA